MRDLLAQDEISTECKTILNTMNKDEKERCKFYIDIRKDVDEVDIKFQMLEVRVKVEKLKIDIETGEWMSDQLYKDNVCITKLEIDLVETILDRVENNVEVAKNNAELKSLFVQMAEARAGQIRIIEEAAKKGAPIFQKIINDANRESTISKRKPRPRKKSEDNCTMM